MGYIGTIQFVQIQRESLKVKNGNTQRYDPQPLLTVTQLRLTRDGVIGLTETGVEIIDVHHTDHPRSRNRADNYVSLGFSHHYDLMRERCGDHLTNGIAGENIIVACDQRITPEMLGERVFIGTQTGERIVLEDTLPIPPCEPFSRFAAGRDLVAPEMKATLQYLSNGTRGFYMRVIAAADGAIIQSGDKVYATE
jgi:MOSC domain-containing protein YiiM